MAVEQTRPYELGLYDGSLDPSTVMVPVDNSAWSRPKRLPLSEFGDALKSGEIGVHIESGRLSGLSNNYVEVEFDTAFDDIPVGRKNLHVYRVLDLGGGKTVDLIIPIYGLGVTVDGFSFYIEDTEDLTGIVCEYLFI